jgi:prepilin peptidase CpaA
MESIAWWPTVLLLAVATLMDLRTRRIPNWLVLPFLAAGLLTAGVTRGMPGIWQSLAGIGLGVGVAGVLCYLRGMGLGDLKLLAAIGAWVGPGQMAVALVATGIAGGLLAVAYAVWRGAFYKLLDSTGDLIVGFTRRGLRPDPVVRLDNPAALKIPYALAIAIGTTISFYA